MEFTQHTPDPQYSSSASASSDLDLQDLEVELQDAREELAHFQAILQELPSIYENKFRQQLHSAAQNIRELLDERKRLQEQVSRALAKPSDPQQLAVPVDKPVKPLPRRSVEGSLPFLSVFQLLSSLKTSLLDRPIISSFRFPLSWRRIFIFGSVILGFALVFQIFFYKTQRFSLPVVMQKSTKPFVASKVSSSLNLMVRGGQSWVLIESLSGLVLMDAILSDGETRVFAIDSGLRIRSGRPDLLYLAIDSKPLKPLGKIDDIGWIEILPPT